jgi:hypothetical protein
VLLTIVVVRHYPKSTDAATILGIVVPVFATVGAAVFGVTAAYQVGTGKGAETGKKAAAKDLAPKVKAAQTAVHHLAEQVRRAGESPSSSEMLRLNAVEVPHQDVGAAEAAMAELQGQVEALL